MGLLKLRLPRPAATFAGGAPEALRCMALAMAWTALVASAPWIRLWTSAAESGLWPTGSGVGPTSAGGRGAMLGGGTTSEFTVILTL